MAEEEKDKIEETGIEPEAAEPEKTEAKEAEPKSKAKGKKSKDKEKEDPPGAHLEPILPKEEKKADYLEPEEELAARYAPDGEEDSDKEPEETEEKEDEDFKAKPAKIDKKATYRATGKRKDAIARVILKAGNGQIMVNTRELEEYFPRQSLQQAVRHPLDIAGITTKIDATVRVHGGGVSGQAQAVRHGIAKALTEVDPELRIPLKRKGLLTRDARVKERRKAGFKKARKRPQFSKR